MSSGSADERHSHAYDRLSLTRTGRADGHRRVSDLSIERELRETLAWGNPDRFSAVRVRVQEGTVFLTGEVSDYEAFRNLDALVAETPGVRYLKNGVLVNPEVHHEPPVWAGED